MTATEEIAAALARLEAHAHEQAVTVVLIPDESGGTELYLTAPLAALIRATDLLTNRIMDTAPPPVDQTSAYAESWNARQALLALCRAIGGSDA